MDDGSGFSPQPSLLDAALAYAAESIALFPCEPNGKRPAVKDWPNIATVDPNQITAWWTDNPNCNIGLVLDTAGRCVVDLDKKAGEDGEATWSTDYAWDAPETRTVETPSGGKHLWFRGSIKSTVRKLGPGIDTRGVGGYVLAPPSVIDGKPYKVVDGREPAALPKCITEALAAVERPRAEASSDVELDTPENIDRARAYLRGFEQRQGLWGEQDDPDTFILACTLKDLGLSEPLCVELLTEPIPEEEEWLAFTVHNAFKYGQNEPGAYGVSSKTTELWNEYARAHPGEPESAAAISDNALAERFRARWPHEYEAMPDLEFWDSDNTLPRSPDGCIAILYGEFGNHKTNVALTIVLDAVLGRGARACYAAGEGAYGVGKSRIPAHCTARGIATKDLCGKFCIVPSVPLFAAPDQVAAFIEAQSDFSPQIVVLDTLATALAGEDENGSRAASFLTANGPAGRIRDAYKALVILPAHAGKDVSRGIRGNSGLGGNVDVVLLIDANKDAGAVKLTVEKMRDGRDGFSTYFKVPPQGSPEVPVPVKITEAEYVALVKAANDDQSLKLSIRLALSEQNARSFGSGLTDRMLAERMAGREPRDDEARRQWLTEREKKRKALRNARRSPWTRELGSEEVPDGGTKLEWRWHVPPLGPDERVDHEN